jgi:alkylation response protein AidB-like acyl-CoA dehydrogenase
MPAAAEPITTPTLQTLPGDDLRQIMWRFADRYDLHMMVQATRAVARGPVARAVAQGERNTHDWTPAKAALLKHYDEAGITSAFMEPSEGGYIEGPKNLALSLLAFELSWVDAGAATASLAGNLGLSPIHERGTPEQLAYYMSPRAARLLHEQGGATQTRGDSPSLALRFRSDGAAAVRRR